MSSKADPVTPAPKPGAWAPFSHSAFAVLWGATVISNVGTWMHEVGAAWLMTTLSPSPLMVALVQAATTLPVFLFALIAGALADLVDRRKILLLVNMLMGGTAALFAVLVALGAMTTSLLLIFTFLFGTGAAFMAPAWQAIVPQLIPKEQLSSAVALNSMGINISRAIGPALAGLLISLVGLAAPFALNALSFIAIIGALLYWRPENKAEKTRVIKEPFIPAILTGLRYAFNSVALTSTLVRAVAFFLFASAYWAMLPLISKDVLQGGPDLYGVLMGLVGAGAVMGALLLPSIRARLDADQTVMAGSLGTAAVLIAFAFIPSVWAAYAGALLGGLFWISVLSSLNVSAQSSLPEWVRARGLSVFLTVFFGSMALGSVVWGQVASSFSIPAALAVAALGLASCVFLTRKWHLTAAGDLNLAPSLHWPAPVVESDVEHDRGPVMVTLEYTVAEGDQPAFLDAIQQLAKVRRRDGALDWNILQDAEDTQTWVEYFIVPSWRAHLLQHDRVTHDDRAIQDAVNALNRGRGGPKVRHLLAADL
ncbi:MFS transporter [Pseudovibrio sp. SPO723]|uniref:MFS transporter n=1 Tax=Nesiotobacter zosterae TaxID=392721 RepID=UPI0029C33C83|nr:MFS transporter [Pseudovibrio sp. SPO723]MDX5593371.1 MFS transporter [Pseudovibrio sp. SPO723]